MDDDGSRNLNYDEFQKGLNDFGVSLEDESVSIYWWVPEVHVIATV